jgi:hypothetical protein
MLSISNNSSDNAGLGSTTLGSITDLVNYKKTMSCVSIAFAEATGTLGCEVSYHSRVISNPKSKSIYSFKLLQQSCEGLGSPLQVST